MNGRIYKVTVNKEEKLVKATTRAQAFRHAANSLVKAELATQEECIALAAGGVLDATAAEVEKANTTATAPAATNGKPEKVTATKTPGGLKLKKQPVAA